MAKDKRFMGVQYPLVRGPHGLFAKKSGTDQIKADLLQLLMTNPGERVMMPNYGTPLRGLVFEPNDEALAFQTKQVILESIRTWEPRVVVTDIEVTPGPDKSALGPYEDGSDTESVLYIQVHFVDPQDINSIESLTLALPTGV